MKLNSNRSFISRDILAYVPVKIVPAITGLLSIILLTRNLTPKEYALYSVTIVTVILLVQLFGSWLSNSVLFFFPEQNTHNNQYNFFKHSLILQIFLTVPAVLSAYIIINLVTQNKYLAIAGCVLVFFQLIQSLMLTFLQSQRKINYQTIIVSLQCIIQIATLCWFLLLSDGKELSAVVAIIIGFISGNIVTFCIMHKLYAHFRISSYQYSTAILRKLLKYGLPMCLWFFFIQFYMVGDRIILQYFGNTNGLGQYSSFRDLATGCVSLLTMPLLMASHPIIMEKWKNQRQVKEIENIISNNIIILTFFFAPLILATHILGKELVVMLFGDLYELSSYIMVLVLSSIYTTAVAMHLQRGLEVTGRTFLMAKLAFTAACSFLTIAYFLIPKFGTLGSSIAVSLSTIIYITLVYLNVRTILLPRINVFFWFKILIWFIICTFIVEIINLLPFEFHILNKFYYLKILIIFTSVIFLYFLIKNEFKRC